jgi:hypothetical protein
MKFYFRHVPWCSAPFTAFALMLVLKSPIRAQESPTSGEDRLRAALQARNLAGVEREIAVQTHDDAALLTGLRDGTPAVRFLRVWHREDGVWRLALVHETPTVRPPNPEPVPAQRPGPTQWPQGRTRDEQEIFAAQRALNETFAKRDVEAYSKLTAPSFIRVTTEGRVNTREQFIASVGDRSGPERQDPNHSEFRLRVFQSAALLSYFNVGGDLQRVTRVFVRQDGIWKQLLTQATVVSRPR